MSSKLLPGDVAGAVRLAWKEVPRLEGAPAHAPMGGSPELTEATARLEQQAGQQAREAHAAGFREGETAGRERAAAESKPLLDRLALSLREMAGLRAQMRREAEADMVRLALEIARRVLRREMTVDPDSIRGLASAALEKLEGQEICRVRLHPAHAAPVAELLRLGGPAQAVEVIADASLQAGAVLFETTRGNLDASVDSQLQEIGRGLADCLRRRT